MQVMYVFSFVYTSSFRAYMEMQELTNELAWKLQGTRKSIEGKCIAHGLISSEIIVCKVGLCERDLIKHFERVF